jgi:erythromycin esterase
MSVPSRARLTVDPGRARLLRWAKAVSVPLSTVKPGPPWDDLAPLGQMIGDARVVALSEAVHGAAEPLEFRNRVLQYLVREKGFTAIAIESGLTEGRTVHDYVRGGTGDLSSVLRQGISWGMHHLPQNRALVRWLREYNADRGHPRKVNFYGFDVPGSPAGSYAPRGSDTALSEALDFLCRVDRAAAIALRARVEAFAERMLFRPHSGQGPGYEQLNQGERDALTAIIVDLLALLERREARYIAASTADDYKWAYRDAIGAQQIDNWLRQIPLGWRPANVRSAFEKTPHVFAAATEVRDRAQADNVAWILGEEGPEGKVLVFASRFHLSAATLKTQFVPGGEEHRQEVAGCYLRRRFGSGLVTVGNVIGGGQLSFFEYHQTLNPPAASVDGLATQIGVPLFLLDLRAAPPAVKEWLSEEHTLVAGEQTLTIPLGEAYDILFYIDTVTSSCTATACGA